MTRQTWNRLRKQRPELFFWIKGPHSWERLSKSDRLLVAKHNKKHVIALLTVMVLCRE